MKCSRARRWTATGSVLILTLLGCGGEEPSPEPEPEPAGTGASTAEAETSVVDREPPRFAGVDGWATTGWGRVRLEWPAATDDVTPPHAMTYRVSGVSAVPPGLGPAPSDPEPVAIVVGPGSISAEVTAPITHATWRVEAHDEAGRATGPSTPLLVRTRPPLQDLLVGGLAAPLLTCERDHDGSLLCLGEDGRLARWREETWAEHELPFSAPVAFTEIEEKLGLHAVSGRFRLGEEDAAEPIGDRFEGAPTYPLRRFAREPSGLGLWLDGSGALWASDGSSDFQRLDDPLLLGPERTCVALRDLWIDGGRALAWCESGQQYLLRPETHGYRWIELPDGAGLPPDARPRRVLFGEGRRITWLDWSGVVWRYDLGGWRPLWEPNEAAAGATAIAPAQDERLVWVASGAEVWAVDALGQPELVARITSRAPIVYLEAEPAPGLAVTGRGGLFSLPEGEPRRELPPGRFALAVRTRTDALELLVESEPPARLIFDVSAGTWSLDPPVSWPADVVVNAVIAEPDGDLLLAVDAGPSGGRIIELRADGDLMEQRFVYPAPADEEAEPVPAPDLEPPPIPEPALRLVGVAADRLPEPPPPEPPVRDVDVNAETETGVAVGEGGRVWLRVEGGWLPIDVGLTLPVPLLTVRVIGDHAYLVGGVDGLVLRCVWDACEAETAPVGDVRALRSLDGVWHALGPGGVARYVGARAWEPVAPELEAPAPSGSPPTAWLDLAYGGGRQWWLGTDGSVWLEHDGALRPMGRVAEPLGLYVDASGRALIASQAGIFGIAPL